MGDTYNVVGLLNALLEKYPYLEIYYVLQPKGGRFVRNEKINVIDKVEARKLVNNYFFDAVVLTQGAMRSPLIFGPDFYLDILKVPYRVCCDAPPSNPKKALSLSGLPLLVTRRISSVGTNGFEDQANAFRALGFDIDFPKFHFTNEGERYADSFFKRHVKQGQPVVFLHPGSGKMVRAIEEGKLPADLWPEERWARVADHFISKYDALVVIDGVGGEENILKGIYGHAKFKKNIVLLTELVPIESMGSLFRRGDILISAETGTAHYGAHTRVPTLVLCGSHDPKFVGARAPDVVNIYNSKFCHGCRQQACDDCHNICMRSISVDEVVCASVRLAKRKGKLTSSN